MTFANEKAMSPLVARVSEKTVKTKHKRGSWPWCRNWRSGRPVLASRQECKSSNDSMLIINWMRGVWKIVDPSQVLENPSNPFERTRSLDTGQGDRRLQDGGVSFDARASSPTHFRLAQTLHDASVNSVLLSIETHILRETSALVQKVGSQVTRAKCQEAVMQGKDEPAFLSSVLSLDGILHFERGDNSSLGTGPQMPFVTSHIIVLLPKHAQQVTHLQGETRGMCLKSALAKLYCRCLSNMLQTCLSTNCLETAGGCAPTGSRREGLRLKLL